MVPQYLAGYLAAVDKSDALESQNRRSTFGTYQLLFKSLNVPPRNTQVSLTPEPGRIRHVAVSRPIVSNRRHRCPRVSNSWQCSAWLPPLPPAQAGSQKKSTWLLIPSPSRLSPYTQASTSKPLPEQAPTPAPHLLSTTTPTAPKQEGV